MLMVHYVGIWLVQFIHCHCAHLTRGPNARTDVALREHGSCLVGQGRCCSLRAWFLSGKLRQMLLSTFLVYVYPYSYTCYPYHSLSSSSSIILCCFSFLSHFRC